MVCAEEGLVFAIHRRQILRVGDVDDGLCDIGRSATRCGKSSAQFLERRARLRAGVPFVRFIITKRTR